MAKTITITYTAITAPTAKLVPQICDIFVTNNNASRQTAFDGTYYDTNVEGFGEATTLQAFMAEMVAHPGLIAALRYAIKNGEYEYTDATNDDVLYAEELKPALKDQGFTITVAEAESNGEG